MRDPQFMARVQRVQEAASGRWLDILIDAGLPEVMLLRLNRPCPLCGGRDRFSFYRNKPDGHWFCRGCGYGDGLSLLQKWRSERFTDTLVYLERVLGLPEYKRQDTGPDSVQTAERPRKSAVRTGSRRSGRRRRRSPRSRRAIPSGFILRPAAFTAARSASSAVIRFWTTGRSSMTEIERISDGPRCSRSSPTTRDGSSRCTGPI